MARPGIAGGRDYPFVIPGTVEHRVLRGLCFDLVAALCASEIGRQCDEDLPKGKRVVPHGRAQSEDRSKLGLYHAGGPPFPPLSEAPSSPPLSFFVHTAEKQTHNTAPHTAFDGTTWKGFKRRPYWTVGGCAKCGGLSAPSGGLSARSLSSLRRLHTRRPVQSIRLRACLRYSA